MALLEGLAGEVKHLLQYGMRWVALGLVIVAACGDERPVFESVLVPSDTPNTVGPYPVEAYVLAPRGVGYVALRFAGDLPPNTRAAELLLTRRGNAQDDEAELWTVDLPGRPADTTYAFYLVAVDKSGQKVTFPAAAPTQAITFTVFSTQP